MKMCDEVKRDLCAAIDKESPPIRDVSLEIWNNPELCFNEHHAHKVITDFLEERGFQVERHYNLSTAFRATMSNGDTDFPTVGVMCEYDALPGIGHACGHNLITAAGLATAVGVKHAMDQGHVKGKLVVLGCPAEEGGGGKIDLINQGAFEDMNVAMMVHPSQHNISSPVLLALHRLKITYTGKESHASASPWEGRNALDAAVLCYQNIAVLRQQMKPTWRVHGIISNGGSKPNVIPSTTELLFQARAPNERDILDLERKLRACAEAAAAATGCEVSFEIQPKGYSALMSNPTLVSLYVKNGKDVGIEFETDPALTLKHGGSTDMANVSRVLPGMHPRASLNQKVPLHTREFAEVAKTEESHRLILTQAKAMAMAAIDMFTDPTLVRQMEEEFRGQIGEDH